MYNYYQQQVPYGNYAGVGYSQNIPGPMGIKGKIGRASCRERV